MIKEDSVRDDVALAHDYLIPMGGAERVVAALHRQWPGAPLYTSAVHRPGLLPELKYADIRASWMQGLPGIEKDFRRYFPLYPFAFRSFRPVKAKVLVISASTFAKCIRGARGTKTVCYCHAPTRFLWADSEYLIRERKSQLVRWVIRAMLPSLRRMDFRAAQRMNVMVANSEFVRKKIEAAYRRDAVVIHPPVNIERFKMAAAHDGFYLIVSRLVGYKGIELAITACSRLNRPLFVIGDGPDRLRLESLAGPLTRFLGKVSESVLQDYLTRCRAFIFPGVEDFGIAPVEAQACGKPVIALGEGGALETVLADETGVFFEKAESVGVEDAIRRFEAMTWDPAVIRRNSLRFSEPRFESQLRSLVEAQTAP